MINKRQMFLNHVGQTSDLPLMLEVSKAEGVFIYDENGKKYYDLNSGICVSSLGHNNPKVKKAIKDQLDKHMHTMVYGEHIQSPQISFAKRLADQLPPNLQSIYFLLSGSEAVETAMKLAKRITGRYEIISCSNAYHGSTQGAESLRSDHAFSGPFLPLLPGISHIDFNDESQLKNISNKTAAVILEPVQAEAGIIPPQDDYLKKLRIHCDRHNVILIFDEIQTGFGRTGKLFAFQKYDVVPDIICIGKSMGGGMPLSGVISSKENLDAFTQNPMLGHITTFGGHPVSCAAADASLEILLEGSLIDEVLEKEKFIKQKLRHPIIAELRSSGLMMAVELTKRKYLKHVVANAIEQGALIDFFLFNRSSFRLTPPLIYTIPQLEKALDILLSAMDFAQKQYKN